MCKLKSNQKNKRHEKLLKNFGRHLRISGRGGSSFVRLPEIGNLECWRVHRLSVHPCWTDVHVFHREQKQGNLWQSYGWCLDLWLPVPACILSVDPHLDA